MNSIRLTIFGAIDEERNRQDEKWGDQSGSYDGTGRSTLPLPYEIDSWGEWTAEYLAKAFTAQTDDNAKTTEGATMAHILLEEVFEAIAESDQEKLTTELVQTAAVVVAWLEYLVRRGVNPLPETT